ncbi:MAG: LOG family protein [Cyclobacteriaceae bacterium]|nr:LOG family protein [Cyclobacteriaceae bacterium]
MKYTEIETETELIATLKGASRITAKAFQNLNFATVEALALQNTFHDCLFLGCIIPESLNARGIKDCLVFPSIDVPFNAFINSLYTKKMLYGAYMPGKPDSYQNTHDKIVYDHYIKSGKEADDIKETLARRLHDHAITDAMYDFLEGYEEKKVVGIMGGHGLSRGEENFLLIAKISKKLTESGYLMVSGGGPGAMEATHVGAWFAGRSERDLQEAIRILAEAPDFKDKWWLDKAFEVLDRYPDSAYKSLGVPTWLYGHEPPTPFASHIAKYFDNSVREDGLLTIAKGGIIFSPGSAGTIQEVFQEATQNHYLSFEYASPMVFLNSRYWTVEVPIYPLIQKMMEEGKYKHLILSLCDTVEEVIREIEKFSKENGL